LLRNETDTYLTEISASGAFSPVFGHNTVELDTSLGNVDIDPLPLSDFIGQTVHFYAVGSGIASIGGGNGVYVNGVYITENTGGAVCRGVSGGLWRLDNGITADWVSGPYRMSMESVGIMITEFFATLTTGVVSGAVYASPAATVAFPVPFATVPHPTYGGDGAAYVMAGSITVLATTGHDIAISTISAAVTADAKATYRGDY
jgi:hypothetical protein